ncbi:MAG: hypothetical protein PHS79_04150 [Patescibacteria group bacterium]|nr:hypothetical protein [Patescibacteria group bacterium]
MPETRTVGIRHRVKKTAEGEARPTQVAIVANNKVVTLDLEDERAELDFVLGKFPIKFRDVEPDEDLTVFAKHHIKWRKAKKDEDVSNVPEAHKQLIEKKLHVAHRVPAAYDGLKAGDVVAMSLGGSGDYLAFALSRQADVVGAHIFRIPPFHLKDKRPNADKDKDAELMAELVRDQRQLFRPVTPRDRDQLLLRIRYRSFEEAMKARIATEQRLRQRLIGEIFTQPDGLYPEGDLEDAFKESKANDKILVSQKAEEAARERDMLAALEKLEAFKVMGPVEGVGTRIAGRLTAAALVNLGRFMVVPDQAEIEKLRLEATEWAEDAVALVNVERKPNEARREYYARVEKVLQSCGHPTRALELEQAIACLDQIRKLKRQAEAKSCNKFKAYCGVHVLTGGKHGDQPEEFQFPRRRSDAVANWNGIARQAFFLVVDQFNKRAESEWGKYLRRMKSNQRGIHPEPIKVPSLNRDGTPKVNKKTGEPILVTRYSDGHIHKRAIWRTATRFAEWLFRELIKFENGATAKLPAKPPEPATAATLPSPKFEATTTALSA